MTEKFAVFIDIDWTLTSENGVHPKNAEAIKMAQKAGHYIFANTGRAKSWIVPGLLGDIEFDGIISGIGAHIEIGGKTIFEKIIDPDFLYSCTNYFWDSKNCLFISGSQAGFILNPLPYFLEWNFSSIDSPDDFKGRYKNEKIQKVEVFGKILQYDKEFLGRELDLYEHGKYVECCPKGCSKAAAMDIVLNHLGIKKENTIAMGDSVNDIDMLKNAGTAVAVGNASDKIKEIADFVSTPSREGGVAYALQELLLKK